MRYARFDAVAAYPTWLTRTKAEPLWALTSMGANVRARAPAITIIVATLARDMMAKRRLGPAIGRVFMVFPPRKM